MAYKLEYTDSALKELKKLDKPSARQIINYLEDNIATQDNPRSVGKALKGPFKSYWRYRTGDYRVICQIEDERIVVIILRISHRKDAYK